MSELIDREALKAAHGLGTDCADCKRDARSCQYDRDFSRMDFCEWIDDAPTASPWHRVEEEPKDEGKYLVSDGRGNYFVAWWGPRLGWCYDPKFFRYWMPIEPPKEDA
jgi:hypothetical protein